MTVLIVVLFIVGIGLAVAGLVPMVGEVVAERQGKRLREEQRLLEARMQMLTYTTLQQMYDVVRSHRDADGQ
jgi:hypothetical protein